MKIRIERCISAGKIGRDGVIKAFGVLMRSMELRVDNYDNTVVRRPS
jgi:hypothetical protein